MNRACRLPAFFSILIIALVAPAAFADNKADLDAQLIRLMEWWPGHYDNHEQVLHHSVAFTALNEKPLARIHTIVQHTQAATLGENQLLVTEYKNNNPKDVVRTELYALAIDEQEDAIRVRRYAHAAIIPGSLEPSPIEIKPGVLSASEFKPINTQCDLLMLYVGGQFEDNVQPRQCVGASGTDYLDKAVIVGDKYQWTRERRLDSKTDKVVYDTAAPGTSKDWFEQTRARLFTCIVLHNQGDEIDMAWPEGRTLMFTIQTRAFTVPTDHEYPLFRVHEKNNPVPIAYAWANDGAKRFGIKLGWFYIRCYEEGDVDPAEERVKSTQK